MQLTIERIEQEMGGDSLSPRQLADFRIFLGALYSLRAGEMQKILAIKPGVWLAYREGTKSDKAADREWQATEEGKRETQVKWELKRIERLSSAIATKLRVMEGEARNQY
jgi:hypothetical protein